MVAATKCSKYIHGCREYLYLIFMIFLRILGKYFSEHEIMQIKDYQMSRCDPLFLEALCLKSRCMLTISVLTVEIIYCLVMLVSFVQKCLLAARHKEVENIQVSSLPPPLNKAPSNMILYQVIVLQINEMQNTHTYILTGKQKAGVLSLRRLTMAVRVDHMY